MTAPREGGTGPAQGRVSRVLTRLFMKQARVSAAETLAPGYRLITLESPAFRDVSWQPGQKVQIAMGSAFVARTYTPIEWDASAGRTRLLAYAHGAGPGSAWVGAAAPGSACDVFGPRGSLDLGRVDGPCVLLGDETAIGLAYALGRAHGAKGGRSLLEVNVAADARVVLARLGLAQAELFARLAGDTHLDPMMRRLAALAREGACFVLTGKASTIQRQRRVLKDCGVPGGRILAKAYWAPGKTGLD